MSGFDVIAPSNGGQAGDARAVGDDRLDAGAADRDGGAGEARGAVDGGDRDHSVARRRRAGHVGARPFVAGRCHDDDARADRVRRGDRIRVVRAAERRTERHVDDVHAVVDGPVDGRDDDVGGPCAAEHADRVQVRLRRDAGADPEVLRWRARVVRPGVGGAVRVDPVARGGAGDVAAVALAVERVGVRMGNRLVRRRGGVGVVRVANEVGAALDARRGGAEQRGVRGLRLRGVGRVVGGHRAGAAEVRMRVVDARVDDADLDALAGVAGVLPYLRNPEERHRDGVVERVGARRVDRDDVRQRRDGVDGLLRERELDAVVGRLHLGDDPAALALDRAGDGVLVLLQAALDRVALARGELAALLRLDDGDGVARHLDDDVDLLIGGGAARHVVRADATVGRRGGESGGRVVVRRRGDRGCGRYREGDRACEGEHSSVQGNLFLCHGCRHTLRTL